MHCGVQGAVFPIIDLQCIGIILSALSRGLSHSLLHSTAYVALVRIHFLPFFLLYLSPLRSSIDSYIRQSVKFKRAISRPFKTLSHNLLFCPLLLSYPASSISTIATRCNHPTVHTGQHSTFVSLLSPPPLLLVVAVGNRILMTLGVALSNLLDCYSRTKLHGV